MFKYLTRKKPLFIAFLSITVLYGAATTAVALVLAPIMDAAAGDSMEALIISVLTAAAFIVLYSALSYVYEKMKALIIKEAVTRLKSDVFTSIMNKDILDYEARNSASYINDLTTNISMIEGSYFNNYFSLLSLIVGFVTAVAVTWAYQPLLLAVMIVLGFLSFGLTKLTGKGIETVTRDFSHSSQQYQVGIKEYFSAFRVIKAFGILGHILSLHSQKSDDVEGKRMLRQVKAAFVGCVGLLTGFLSTIIIMGVAAVFSVMGMVSVGAVLAVGHLMGHVTSPISALPQILINFKSVTPIVADLNKLMQDKAKEEPGLALTGVREIAISDMGFSYAKKNVLESISVEIKAGNKYAIIGASGSGKTTFFSLLLGYYGNYEGSIRYDGTEVRQLNKSDIYKVMGTVFQDSFLFDDTLRNNITLYDSSFTDEEILEAVNNAGLSEFVADYPGKLDGKITENGKNISGGQRQRISLARVLLRKPPILLLDEFSASLDSKTAFDVEQHLLSLKDTTMLSITHRLNKALLMQYDKIIVLRDGQIVELGSYEELMAKNEYFSSLLMLFA